MNTVRERRLRSDFDAAQAMVTESCGRLDMELHRGAPPESYVFIYNCRGLAEIIATGPVYSHTHRVRIQLPASYPAAPPIAAMLSPLFHPHVWPNRALCLGSWNPGEKLDSILGRIGAILTYDPDGLNWRSVANDAAASWARRHVHLFPLDKPYAHSASFIAAKP